MAPADGLSHQAAGQRHTINTTETVTMTTTKKTTCPITRSQFTAAKEMAVQLAGQSITAKPKGVEERDERGNLKSLGFYANGKVQIVINGVPVMCQVGMNITVIGSKELPAISQEVKETPRPALTTPVVEKPQGPGLAAALAGVTSKAS